MLGTLPWAGFEAEGLRLSLSHYTSFSLAVGKDNRVYV